MNNLTCLTCVIERKMAEQLDTAANEAQLPELRPALTLASTEFGPVTPLCYEHLVVQRQSPLLQGPPVAAAAPSHHR